MGPVWEVWESQESDLKALQPEGEEGHGATLKILPRYGKLFDPIEMVFGDTKRINQKKVGEKLRSMKPSELKFEIRAKLWHDAEKEVGPKSFIRAFKERANGQEFFRVNKEKGLE